MDLLEAQQAFALLQAIFRFSSYLSNLAGEAFRRDGQPVARSFFHGAPWLMEL